MGKRFSVIFDTEVGGMHESDLSAIGVGVTRGADRVWREPRDIFLGEGVEVRREDDDEPAWDAEEELAYGGGSSRSMDDLPSDEYLDDDSPSSLRLMPFASLVLRRREIESRVRSLEDALEIAVCTGAERLALLARREIDRLNARLERVNMATLGKICPELRLDPVPTTSLAARRKSSRDVH